MINPEESPTWYQYGLFVCKLIGECEGQHEKMVMIEDKKGNQKKVYKKLWDKHAKLIKKKGEEDES